MSGYKWTIQDYVYVTAECVIGALSVLGNGLVLMAIYKTRALRTVTNCFIGSLALADTLVGLVVPPTVILPYLGLPKNFYGCVFINTVVVLITNISILNLLTVALERYLAISDPFRYQRLMTIKRAMAVVVVTWIIAILLGLIPTLGWNLGSDDFEECSFTKVIDMKYMIYLVFFGVSLPPLIFMLIIYIYIFHIIRKQQRRTVAQLTVLSRDERRNVRQQKREIRGAKGLAYVIILFAVCWLPLHIMNSISLFAPEKSGPYQLLLVTIVLSHANSFVNPFLYAFSNSQFKRAMKRILCCGALQSSYSSDSSDGNTTLRASRARDGKVVADVKRSDANGYPFNTAIKSPNGQTPIVTVVENLYNSSEQDKESQPQEVAHSNGKGVVNKAYHKEDTDSSDDEDSPTSSTTPPLQRKALRWNENVETIPSVQNSKSNDPEQGGPSHGNMFIVNENTSAQSIDSNIHDQVWVTPSSQYLKQNDHSRERESSPSAEKYYNFSLLLQEEVPCKNSSVSNRAFQLTDSNSDEDIARRTDIQHEDSRDMTYQTDQTLPSVEQESATNVFNSTEPAERRDSGEQDKEGKEKGEEPSVAFSCAVDEEERGEEVFGSKEFVSIRL